MRRSASSTRSTSSSSSRARSAASVRRDAEQASLQDHQLAAGLADVEPGLLQGDADLPAHRVGIGGHVDPGDACVAGGERHERRQHPDGRRLAGTVRPEEAEDLAALDMQVDAAHRLDVATAAGVVLDELLSFHRKGHEPTRSSLITGSRDASVLSNMNLLLVPGSRHLIETERHREVIAAAARCRRVMIPAASVASLA